MSKQSINPKDVVRLVKRLRLLLLITTIIGFTTTLVCCISKLSQVPHTKSALIESEKKKFIKVDSTKVIDGVVFLYGIHADSTRGIKIIK
jgi:hypothetical protein